MEKLKFDNKNDANILEQLASYNKSDINNLINNLQIQLEEQKELNNVLSKKNSEEDIEQLNNFISENKKDIDSQETELQYLVEEMKKIVKNNKEKILDKQELSEIVNSEKTKEIAIKIRNIRSLKESIQSFLVKNGIIQTDV
tara:strand:+ start:134 stop:559 length:426 start_codon:yes stop_codon:yes gene_type:complete